MTTLTARLVTPSQLGLRAGPAWESFEALRSKHAEQLEQIQPGTVGHLKVKRRSFVIVDESDFTSFKEVLLQIEELASQLRILKSAAGVAERHMDDASANMLRETSSLAVKKAEQVVDQGLKPFRLDVTAVYAS